MIKKEKFLKLPLKTRYNQIAKALDKLRNQLLIKEEYFSEELEIKTFTVFLEEKKEWPYQDLLEIIKEKSSRKKLEKTHFLYHTLKEKVGFPVSEGKFIQLRNDRNLDFVTQKSELVIILDNLRSAFNVGSFFRMADCFAVKEIFITGVTPEKDNLSVIKTAKGTEKLISSKKLRSFAELESVIFSLKEIGYDIIASETAAGSENLYKFKFNSKTALIFGNEELGISEDLLNLCNQVVEIPLKGVKNSLNVATAGAAIISEYNRQQGLF